MFPLVYPKTGGTLLHYWAANDMIKDFVDIVQKVNPDDLFSIKDFYGNTILHYATASSSIHVTEFLITFIYNKKIVNIYGVNPSHVAAQKGDHQIIEKLSNVKPMNTDLTLMKWSILHFAVYFNHFDAVQFIITKYPQLLNLLVNGIDKSISAYPDDKYLYVSALDIAIMRGYSNIAQLLLNSNALSTLHAAIATHNNQAIHYFVSNPILSKQFINSKQCNSGFTPLHLAASLSDHRIVHYLIKSNCKVDVLDSDGFTPLDLACASGSLPCVEELKDLCSAEHLAKATFLAAAMGRKEIVLSLISERILNAVDSNGDSLLIKMVKTDNSKAVNVILKMNPDLFAKDSCGATALHYAAGFTMLAQMTAMVSKMKGDPGIEVEDNFGRTPLMYAALNLSRDSFAALRNAGADPNHADKSGLTPLATAAASGFLAEMKPTPEQVNKRLTVDFEAALSALAPISRTFCVPRYGLESNLKHIESKIQITAQNLSNSIEIAANVLHKLRGATIMSVALALNAVPSCIQSLLIIDRHLVNLQDDDGLSPLHIAAKLSSVVQVDTLLRAYADTKLVDNEGNTILHFITTKSMAAQVEFIYANSTLTADITNKKGQTPLHAVCVEDSVQLLKIHCEHLSNTETLTKKDVDGHSPADIAWTASHKKCLMFLFECGVPNPLIEATDRHDTAEVQKLLDAGHPINSTDADQLTALHHAAKNSDKELVEILIEKGADPMVLTREGLTPLHFAARSGSKEVCALIAYCPNKYVLGDYRDMPFTEALEPELRQFLFKLWKRQLFVMNLNDIVARALSEINIAKDFLRNVSEKLKAKKKTLKILTQFNSFEIALRAMVSQVSGLVLRGNAFMYSLHHPLVPLMTLSTDKLCADLVSSLLEIMEVGKTLGAGYTHQKTLFAIIIPLHVLNNLGECVSRIASVCVPEIDNIAIVKRVSNAVQDKVRVTAATIERICQAFTAFLNQELHSQKFEKITTLNAQLPLFCACAEVLDVHIEASSVLDVGTFSGLRRIFGNDFSLPRTVPFRSRQAVTATLIAGQLIIADEHVEYVLPTTLVYARPMGRSRVVFFSTPNGSFKLSFGDTCPSLAFFAQSIMAEDLALGVAGMHEAREKPFEAAVAYQLGGHRSLMLTLVTVMASNAECAADLCRNFVKDTADSQVLSCKVVAREAPSDDYIFLD